MGTEAVEPGDSPNRLNGWKEIAGYLGKGVRTAQRWEKIYGLPVHRIGREGGEIIFAFRDEIDRWAASADQVRADGEEPPPMPAWPPAAPEWPRAARDDRTARSRHATGAGPRWRLAAGVLLAVAATIGATAMARRGAPRAASPTDVATRQAAAWRLANESLSVLDAEGRLVFEHRFGFPVGDRVTSESLPPGSRGPVVIADIEGDGWNEVLVAPGAPERAERRLYCFEADGRVRFVHQPKGSRRFGEDEYGEPWLASGVFVTRGPSGAKRLWATFTHNLLFPCVLRELDPRDGSVLQEYWSNGYVTFVTEVTWAGRPVVLVGGTNNDHRAASLAVFPPHGVTGSAPAERPAYACRDCARGGPEAFYLFPTLCPARRMGGQAGILEAWVEGGDRLRVNVGQPTRSGRASTFYTLGPSGTLRNAEISREFQAHHAVLERDGDVDHPFGPSDDRDMLPVLVHDGSGFRELGEVPIDH
jgi:hypothetical protein